MSDAQNLWPTRKTIPEDLERLVTPGQAQIRKFVRFGLTQAELKRILQPGCRLSFMGEAQGAITVEIIEDAEGRDVVNDRAFRLRGKTDKGLTVIAHIWFQPAENENEARRTAIFFDTSRATSTPEKPKVETKIRFGEGWENVRDNAVAFSTGATMDLRVQSSTDWTLRTVSILSRSNNTQTGTIIFKVMGEHKLATVVLDLRQPAESKIIFDE